MFSRSTCVTAMLVAVILSAHAAAQCGPGNGDCCIDNGTPGCDDADCCNLVCGFDPFCCDMNWDAMCAMGAFDFCGGLCNPCGPQAGDCFQQHPNPGCESPSCCQQVCQALPQCCQQQWDVNCVNAALIVCRQLPGVQLFPGQGLDLLQLNLTHPGAELPDSRYGYCVADWQQIAANTGIDVGFINVATDNGWVVRNLPLDAPTGWPGFGCMFDLGQNGPVPALPVHARVTPDALHDFNAPPDVIFPVGKEEWNPQGFHEIRDVPPPFQFPLDQEDVQFVSNAPKRRFLQQMHTAQQQKLNQCAPGATADCLQWLEDTYATITVPHAHTKGQLDNSLMGWLDKYMKRKVNQPVANARNLIRGTLKYLKKNGLGNKIKVKHKERPGQKWLKDTYTLGPAKSTKDKTNTSLIDWMIKELQAGENVEMQLGYGEQGHYVKLVGGGYTQGQPWLGWIHDANQLNNNKGTGILDGGIQFSHVVKNNYVKLELNGKKFWPIIQFAVSKSPTGAGPESGVVPSACDCPLIGQPEPEACGVEVNNTCVTATPIGCGDTVCATAWADGGVADTDWYVFDVVDRDFDLDGVVLVAVTLASTLPVDVDLFEASDCGALVLLSSGKSIACDDLIEVVAEVPAPGTYAVRVTPQDTAGFPCVGNNDYVFTVTCDEQISPCGDVAAGDCFTANGTPGCSDLPCCEAVVLVDSYCFDVAWDQGCAGAAAIICGGDDSACVPGALNCASEHDTPGCADAGGCCQLVCAEDPECCTDEWHVLCVDLAEELCAITPCPWDLDSDGLVGIVDFLTLLSRWGPNPLDPADFDVDGAVGIVDFLEMLGNWGPCP